MQDGIRVDWETLLDPELIKHDVVNPVVLALVEQFRRTGHKIVILTGRVERQRKATLQWLEQNGVRYDEIHTRSIDETFLPDREFKGAKVRDLRGRYEIVVALEDRDVNCEMLREMGVRVWKIWA